MKINLDLRKSIEENASTYFEQAKKARSKIQGAEQAIERARKAQKKDIVVESKKQAPKKIRKRAWYEKFKWFMTSQDKLVIAGRDATTNEMIIKKHVEPEDIIFHTDVPGSPFVVIKGKPTEEEIKEAANFCASHSRAWKANLSAPELYWVNPDQVTKEAKAGEYMVKGSFMVYGKRNYVEGEMRLAACQYEDKIMIGPVSAIEHHTKDYVIIRQGDIKPSDLAKQIMKQLGGEPDDIIPGLPSGGCRLEQKPK